MPKQRLTIKQIRVVTAVREMQGRQDMPINPSIRYRIAMAPTRKPYNFKHSKMRRKIAKRSRQVNRKQTNKRH